MPAVKSAPGPAPGIVNGGSAPPPPLLPHQRVGSPPPNGNGSPIPSPPGANGAPRTQGHRPLPHTLPETTLPPALRASLDRLAGRQATPPPAPSDREHTEP